MKLVRFGEKGKERPGVWMGDGRILDVRAIAFHIEDFNEHFFTHDGIHQLEILLKDSGAAYVDANTVPAGTSNCAPFKNYLCGC